MTPTFLPRAEPLAPRAIVGAGPASRALLERLLRGSDAWLERLQLVWTPELTVVLGPGDELPWVDGALYLGAEAGTPALLVPTTKQTSLPLPLVERALRRTTALPTGPLALLSMQLVVPLGRASTPTHATLQSLLGNGKDGERPGDAGPQRTANGDPGAPSSIGPSP